MADRLARAEELLVEGNYYEAQQLYRTIYNRLVKKNDLKGASQLAFDGAMALLKYKQASSATDLAELMLESHKLTGAQITDDIRERILSIFKAYEPTEPLRNRFIETIFKWAKKVSGNKFGDPQLHHLIGLELAKESNAFEAQAHLLAGTADSPEPLARLLFAVAQPQEREYFCLRVVLQYLCLQNLRDANAFYRVFTRLCYQQDPSLRVAQTTVPTSSAQNPSVQTRSIVTSKLPLFNFSLFLLLLAERNSLQLFQTLRQNYQAALKTDPTFDQMLDRIGEIYFGIRSSSQSGGIQNLLGNMSNLMRMFGGGAPGLPGDD